MQKKLLRWIAWNLVLTALIALSGCQKKQQGIPRFYDCREAQKAPKLKNQGTLGTCWAITAASALESRLMPKEKISFSADHISTQNAYQTGQERGGASLVAIAYFAAWQGPVTEEMDPYGDGVTPEGLQPVKHIQEIQMVTDRNVEDIKEFIYHYGAVQSSVYLDMGEKNAGSNFYDPENASYFYDGTEEVNHDILLIGWDDTYPAENFTQKPTKDGAFLCQNSWGENFGENGIFYVSYEDCRVGSNVVCYTKVEETDNYDHIYQSDLCGWMGRIGYQSETCWFANVYTADSLQRLQAVGFYAVGKNTQYEIYVAESFQNEFSLVLAEKIQEGVLEKVGFYTVDLQQTFQIEQGERFAVIVKIKTPNSEYPAAIEYQTDDLDSNVILGDGEGYISSDGYRWESVEREYKGNVCLKAYTSEER